MAGSDTVKSFPNILCIFLLFQLGCNKQIFENILYCTKVVTHKHVNNWKSIYIYKQNYCEGKNIIISRDVCSFSLYARAQYANAKTDFRFLISMPNNVQVKHSSDGNGVQCLNLTYGQYQGHYIHESKGQNIEKKILKKFDSFK